MMTSRPFLSAIYAIYYNCSVIEYQVKFDHTKKFSFWYIASALQEKKNCWHSVDSMQESVVIEHFQYDEIQTGSCW